MHMIRLTGMATLRAPGNEPFLFSHSEHTFPGPSDSFTTRGSTLIALVSGIKEGANGPSTTDLLRREFKEICSILGEGDLETPFAKIKSNPEAIRCLVTASAVFRKFHGARRLRLDLQFDFYHRLIQAFLGEIVEPPAGLTQDQNLIQRVVSRWKSKLFKTPFDFSDPQVPQIRLKWLNALARLQASYGFFWDVLATLKAMRAIYRNAGWYNRSTHNLEGKIARTFVRQDSHPARLFRLTIDYPQDHNAWQLKMLWNLSAFDDRENFRTVEIPLWRVVPFHYVLHKSDHFGQDFEEGFNATRELMLYRLFGAGWKPGDVPSEDMIRSTLLYPFSDRHKAVLPAVSRNDGHYHLLLDGHRRLSALVTLVADGLLPLETLERPLPFRSAGHVPPRKIVHPDLIDEYLPDARIFGWEKCLGFYPSAGGVLRKLGAVKRLGVFWKQGHQIV